MIEASYCIPSTKKIITMSTTDHHDNESLDHEENKKINLGCVFGCGYGFRFHVVLFQVLGC